jgi:hypothetical protein
MSKWVEEVHARFRAILSIKYVIWREFGPGRIGIKPLLQGIDPVLHSLWSFE